MSTSVVGGDADGAQSDGTRAVYGAFQILDAIAAASEPPRMTDIVNAVELPKSSVYRLLRALEATNAVRRGERDKRYRLGSKFDDYAKVSQTPLLVSRFHDVAAPLLRPLDETVQLGVLTGVDVTFLACIDSTKPVRLVSYPGRTLPTHASATGKAILAFAGEQALHTVLDGGLPALTPQTITSPEVLTNELEDVRRLGYATESEESVSNLSCIAAPVWGSAGEVVAAITVCIPRATLPTERLPEIRDALLEAAQRLSGRRAAAPPS
ncbi:IclR family transcriptional regulator [Mycobacterium sp. ITM-2016-00317]|uniref:IclR family transcriptional regulator n=1 Tax=Mycobacterium sp. ITM-2016-00317 TaxID=2099694 RepID=UPI00287F5070|nr:IclR family transcriptional regulator [Mycobacterium sp. ITM-2016-00317]WNG87613.1 IclR family transcriptional regulator [Mycobacterium sp. ITM-2016-00317]